MKQLVTISSVVLLHSLLAAQGGQGGGFGGGGFGGGAGQGGMQQEVYDRSMQSINNRIDAYFEGDPIRNILTPEGFSEWTLDLEAGQVVIAEAWSDAFDPMLEVTRGDEVLGTNDDRFPGDQRPLLLWRCQASGAYSLKARSFRDKAGGQFFIRFKVYDSIDAGTAQSEPKTVKRGKSLVRIPMKAGQIKSIRFGAADKGPLPIYVSSFISPIGLPDVNLAGVLGSAAYQSLLAPVTGDYYALVIASRDAELIAAAEEIPVSSFSGSSVSAQTNAPRVWTLAVKQGQLLELQAEGIFAGAPLEVYDRPEIEKYDLSIAEQNPFYPKAVRPNSNIGSAIIPLPGRSRDQRRQVFAVTRDATLFIATTGSGLPDQSFSIRLGNAATAFREGVAENESLKIGNTDYWIIDASVGDVMTLKSAAQGFAQQITIWDPSIQQIAQLSVPVDENELRFDLFAQKPGKYIVGVSCLGNGGAGTYSISRKTFLPKTFDRSNPAQGDLSGEDVHVWRFTATPEEPLLINWQTSEPTVSFEVRTDGGNPSNLPMTMVKPNHRYGILKVEEPTTYIIILKATGSRRVSYSMKLEALPGISK